MGRGADPQHREGGPSAPSHGCLKLSFAEQTSPAGQWLFLDPRESWIPRELGLACSQRCLEP